MILRSFASFLLLLGAAAGSVVACGDSLSDAASTDAGPEAAAALPRSPGPDAEPDEPFDSGVVRWCSTQGPHSFCADFDGKSVTEGWQAFGTALGHYSAVASDRSPPRAFSVTQ